MGNKFTELMNIRKWFCIALLLTVCLLSSASVKDTACILVPAERQLKWHEAELGVVFHYDLHVFDGQAYGQGSNRITPVEDYNIFAPEHLDTDQWIRGYVRPRLPEPVLPYLRLLTRPVSVCGRAT